MKARSPWVIAVVSAVLAVGIWFAFFRSDDEGEIRSLLDRFNGAVRVIESETNPVSRIARIHAEFAEVLSEYVELSVPDLASLPGGAGEGSGRIPRRQLATIAAQASQLWSKADVSLAGYRVEIDAAKKLATVRTSATLTATRHGGQTERDERAVSFRFDKRNGHWCIVAITVAPRS